MDGRGGCCLVRRAGDADVASKVELIMLRFRPIAPKPASPVGSPPSASPGSEPKDPTAGDKVGGATGRRRGRRNGVGRRGRKRSGYPQQPVVKKRVVSAEDRVTLQLMPETPERKEQPAAAVVTSPTLPDLGLSYAPAWSGLDWPGTSASPATPVGSWLTLECVTDTCQAVEGRPTWAEARRALEGDASPAFLSDASDRVAWTNAAYRTMVRSADQLADVAVVLVTGGRLPPSVACGGFSCSLRVRYGPSLGDKGSLMAPCDVWRLAEEGWLAWRLDVKAALSLGR